MQLITMQGRLEEQMFLLKSGSGNHPFLLSCLSCRLADSKRTRQSSLGVEPSLIRLKSILSTEELTEIFLHCSEGRGCGRGWSVGKRGKYHRRTVFWRALLVDGMSMHLCMHTLIHDMDLSMHEYEIGKYKHHVFTETLSEIASAHM